MKNHDRAVTTAARTAVTRTTNFPWIPIFVPANSERGKGCLFLDNLLWLFFTIIEGSA
jgi:hypothetical protein